MTSNVTAVRRSARAVLIDDQRRLVTIRRTKPGMDPYWTMPGGGVEESDADLVDAVVRELDEELGATAEIGTEICQVGDEHFFLARLVRLDAAAHSGPEFVDPARGGYDVDHISVDQLDEYDLKPAAVRDYIVANAADLLADLPS